MFFQCALLAGYASTHAASTWFSRRWSAAAYLILLVIPFAFLPFSVTPDPVSAGDHPLLWLTLVLAGTIGAPFFVLAATTSALQKAFAETSPAARRNPYFLYAGGVALLPLPMEAARPRFRRRTARALAVLAAEAWREGCLNESAASEEARFAAGDAQGEAREMLATIATDEARHAELSWSVLAWVSSLDPSLLVVTVSTDAPRSSERRHFDPALARHGLPSPSVTDAARDHAWRMAAARGRVMRRA
jgi:hypothetical protein